MPAAQVSPDVSPRWLSTSSSSFFSFGLLSLWGTTATTTTMSAAVAAVRRLNYGSSVSVTPRRPIDESIVAAESRYREVSSESPGIIPRFRTSELPAAALPHFLFPCLGISSQFVASSIIPRSSRSPFCRHRRFLLLPLRGPFLFLLFLTYSFHSPSFLLSCPRHCRPHFRLHRLIGAGLYLVWRFKVSITSGHRSTVEVEVAEVANLLEFRLAARWRRCLRGLPFSRHDVRRHDVEYRCERARVRGERKDCMAS